MRRTIDKAELEEILVAHFRAKGEDIEVWWWDCSYYETEGAYFNGVEIDVKSDKKATKRSRAKKPVKPSAELKRALKTILEDGD